MLLEKFGWSDAKVDEALPRLWRMGELVIPRSDGTISNAVVLVRYADDSVPRARKAERLSSAQLLN